MPEMPEVEQVRKTLLPHVRGHKILQAEVYLPRLVVHPELAAFQKGVAGRIIIDIKRRGKYLRLELDDGSCLLAHLRMTGALLALPSSADRPDYARLKFVLDGEEDLWFTDIRTFGVIYWLAPEDPYRVKGYETLGPEPLSPELTLTYLWPKLNRSRKPIKSFILDQTIIAGLGNIYADESLALARILPLRTAGSLSKKEAETLLQAVNTVIAQGIANHGTTFRNYQDGNGEKGSNQEHLLVYGRKGKACPFCGKTLQQIKVGGRGSVYCPHCQK